MTHIGLHSYVCICLLKNLSAKVKGGAQIVPENLIIELHGTLGKMTITFRAEMATKKCI